MTGQIALWVAALLGAICGGGALLIVRSADEATLDLRTEVRELRSELRQRESDLLEARSRDIKLEIKALDHANVIDQHADIIEEVQAAVRSQSDTLFKIGTWAERHARWHVQPSWHDVELPK